MNLGYFTEQAITQIEEVIAEADELEDTRKLILEDDIMDVRPEFLQVFNSAEGRIAAARSIAENYYLSRNDEIDIEVACAKLAMADKELGVFLEMFHKIMTDNIHRVKGLSGLIEEEATHIEPTVVH